MKLRQNTLEIRQLLYIMYCKIDYINSTNTLSQSYYRKERKKTDRKYLLTHFDFTTIEIIFD